MSKFEQSVPASTLHQLLSLDDSTGRLTWKPRLESHFKDGFHSAQHQCNNWNCRFALKEAFYTSDQSGYLQGYIFSKLFSAARVVFALHSGAWPMHHIDHINGNKKDNRPINLRDVSSSDNMRNRAISSNSKTGACGVSLHAGKYDAYITVEKTKTHIGRFSDISDAIAARKSAEIANGYHANHGRTSS